MIVQGDQYLIPIVIRTTELITPENSDDVRIQIGNSLKTYSKGEITYENEQWYYPLTEDISMMLESPLVEIQVGIKQNNEIRYSDVKQIDIVKSIIKKEW